MVRIQPSTIASTAGPGAEDGGHIRDRTTKIHALSDPLCRPSTFRLTPGQDSDIATGPEVLADAPAMSQLLADKGYDGDDFRAEVIKRGASQ